jgi:hypothetical protein
MFSVEERDRVRDGILEIARADTRIVAGAMIGSLAAGGGDRWSDLDLGFGLADGVSPAEVLADWTPRLEREHGAVHLFDLPSLSSLYRVFLLPGNLQVDLSFTPASDFGARGPKFKVLFGSALERAPAGKRCRRRTTCSDSASTTRCGRASASSVGDCGKRNTGSAAFAIRPWR